MSEKEFRSQANGKMQMETVFLEFCLTSVRMAEAKQIATNSGMDVERGALIHC